MDQRPDQASRIPAPRRNVSPTSSGGKHHWALFMGERQRNTWQVVARILHTPWLCWENFSKKTPYIERCLWCSREPRYTVCASGNNQLCWHRGSQVPWVAFFPTQNIPSVWYLPVYGWSEGSSDQTFHPIGGTEPKVCSFASFCAILTLQILQLQHAGGVTCWSGGLQGHKLLLPGPTLPQLYKRNMNSWSAEQH